MFGLEFVFVDKMIKVELEGFVWVVFECFGERIFFFLVVKDVDGEIYCVVIVGMNFG